MKSRILSENEYKNYSWDIPSNGIIPAASILTATTTLPASLSSSAQKLKIYSLFETENPFSSSVFPQDSLTPTSSSRHPNSLERKTSSNSTTSSSNPNANPNSTNNNNSSNPNDVMSLNMINYKEVMNYPKYEPYAITPKGNYPQTLLYSNESGPNSCNTSMELASPAFITTNESSFLDDTLLSSFNDGSAKSLPQPSQPPPSIQIPLSTSGSGSTTTTPRRISPKTGIIIPPASTSSSTATTTANNSTLTPMTSTGGVGITYAVLPHCVMCGGTEVEIPSQNKNICKSCDSSYWLHLTGQYVFKFCKGCKNFFPLIEFKDKPEGTKCYKCRERGRSHYLAKKQKQNQKELTNLTIPNKDFDTPTLLTKSSSTNNFNELLLVDIRSTTPYSIGDDSIYSMNTITSQTNGSSTLNNNNNSQPRPLKKRSLSLEENNTHTNTNTNTNNMNYLQTTISSSSDPLLELTNVISSTTGTSSDGGLMLETLPSYFTTSSLPSTFSNPNSAGKPPKRPRYHQTQSQQQSQQQSQSSLPPLSIPMISPDYDSKSQIMISSPFSEQIQRLEIQSLTLSTPQLKKHHHSSSSSSQMTSIEIDEEEECRRKKLSDDSFDSNASEEVMIPLKKGKGRRNDDWQWDPVQNPLMQLASILTSASPSPQNQTAASNFWNYPQQTAIDNLIPSLNQTTPLKEIPEVQCTPEAAEERKEEKENAENSL